MKQFWLMVLMIFGSIFYGIFLVAAFKNFGSTTGGIDDATLTLSGSVGAFVNGIFRFIWSALLDKYSFKLIYSIILVTQVIMACTVYFVVQQKYLYMLWIIISYACLGGNFTTFPVASVQVFGMKAGGILFGFICLANGASSFLGFILYTYATFISEEAFFFIAGALSLMSLIVLHVFFDMDALGLNKIQE
jgi:MFS family permease